MFRTKHDQQYSERYRTGMTLIESLVVISLITILLALLLPTIHALRAAARQTQCLNNARQIALAAQNFHDTHRHLPTMPLMNPQSPGWSLDLLPFLEQTPLYRSFNLTGTVDDPINARAAATGCPSIYQCPEINAASLPLITPNAQTHHVKPGHYVLNSEVLNRPLGHFPSTDTTMLARDSGSSVQMWHSSPFVSSMADGSDAVHVSGNVVCFLSGRAAVVTNEWAAPK